MNLPPDVVAACERLAIQPAAAKPVKQRKYRNQPCELDGHKFDSRKEAKCYLTLRLLVEVGAIRDLKLQPRYVFEVNGVKVGTYKPDFRFVEALTGRVVVQDVKSNATKTTAYRLRKKLMRAIHGIEVVEV